MVINKSQRQENSAYGLKNRDFVMTSTMNNNKRHGAYQNYQKKKLYFRQKVKDMVLHDEKF